jgi:hypothetical protein
LLTLFNIRFMISPGGGLGALRLASGLKGGWVWDAVTIASQDSPTLYLEQRTGGASDFICRIPILLSTFSSTILSSPFPSPQLSLLYYKQLLIFVNTILGNLLIIF